MQISLNAIPNALETRIGLPRPNWQVVVEWVEANASDQDQVKVWTQLADDWVEALRSHLPSGYQRHDSDNFVLLAQNERWANKVLNTCEYSLKVILDSLAGVAQDEGYGKYIVFAFSDVNTYYDYVCDFYPDEGEFGSSGGMFIGQGYGHFALSLPELWNFEKLIAHELTHALVCDLPLPIWLDEGIAQLMEDVVVESSEFMVNHETLSKHRAYWNADTIDAFWSGASFSFADDGQGLSYHLAQILIRNLTSDYQTERIKEFIKSAHYSDAGDSALQKICNTSLNERVAQFLGQGDWKPRSDYA